MKAWLEIQRTSGVDKRPITPQGTVGRAKGECPGCGVSPFLVQGGNVRIKDEQTLMSDGRCVKCHEAVGYIYARPDTIFGLTEDANVLIHGRARVY